MKHYGILFFTFLVAGVILSGCSKLDEIESRVQKLEELAKLPKGIIITSKPIVNISKGDIVELGIIVNPSDFTLAKENLSLLTEHHLYTATDTKSNPETPFDYTAHCDLTIVGLTPNESIEGAYNLAIEVDGEGNFFDDIDVYVLYHYTDKTGKMSRICSNSSISIHLIPEIRDAFNFEVPNQSFYEHGLDLGGFVDLGVKSQYIGMWMKRYKDDSGAYRVYDRSLITSIKLETEGKDTTVSLYSEKFKTAGYLKLTIFDTKDYWVNAVKDYKEKGIASVTYPKGHGITFDTSNGDSVTYPLDTAKVFFQTNFSQSKTVKYADLKQTLLLSFNIGRELKTNGSDGSFKKMINIIKDFGELSKAAGSVMELDLDNDMINLIFPYLMENMKNRDYVQSYYHSYSYGNIQNDQGLFIKDNETAFPLLDFYMKMNFRITD